MKNEPIGTLLVGPSALLREGLARILSPAGFRVLASTSSVDDHVLSLLPQVQSTLLIIDVSDDFATTLRQIESFKQRHSAGRVALLNDRQQLTEMVAAFRAGANAHLVKVTNCDTFIKSLELVMLGATLLPPEILTLISDRQDRSRNARAANARDDPDQDADENDDGDGDDGEMVATNVGANEAVKGKTSHTPRLSLRQQSILACLIQGASNKTIARKMAISEATVKVHVKAILRKIRVHNRTQAAIWAMSTSPFIAAKTEASPAAEEPPAEQVPSLTVSVMPGLGENGSTLLPTLKHRGANHAALSNIAGLVAKGVRRNSG